MKRVFSAPTKVDLCITSRCNMRCKHCFAATRGAIPDDLPTQEIKRIIERLNDAKVFIVTLTGGEPLLRPDFFEIARFIRRYPVQLGLNTNATLVNDKVSKELADIGFQCRISVSLDGSNSEIHERLRGRGTFEPALRGLESLLKFNKNTRPFCVVTKYNMHDIENIIKLVKSVGASYIELNTLLPGDRAICYKDMFLEENDRLRLFNEMGALLDTYGNYVHGSLVRMVKKARLLTGISDKELSGMKTRCLQNCDAGFEMAAIRSDGKVAPCYTMLDYVVGDILDESLRDIWKYSDKLWDFRKMHDISLDDIEPCNHCIYKGMCNAGCRAAAYYHSGKTRFDAYDPGGCYRFLKRELNV